MVNISTQCVLNKTVIRQAVKILERASKFAIRCGPDSPELYSVVKILDELSYYGDLLKAHFIHVLGDEEIINIFGINAEILYRDTQVALVEFYKRYNRLYI